MDVSRVYRLLKLITLIRSGREFDGNSLGEELGVSRRTLFRDLKMLEHAGVPLRFERAQGAYSISDQFFLPPLHLDLQEAIALLLVTRKFLARQVHPIYQKAVDAALKIESNLPSGVLKYCGNWLDGVTVQWPPLSSAENVADIFQVLQSALAHRFRIRGQYDSVMDRQEIEVHLEPLRLVFMSRGWYLVANSLLHKQIRTFKVDRFVRVTVTNEKFERDPGFDEKRHFGAAWRMIPEGRIYEVRLRFSAAVATSVEEVLWHASQATARLADGSLEFDARVDGLSEITPWILGYADQVEVLAPPELRRLVGEKARNIAMMYREAG